MGNRKAYLIPENVTPSDLDCVTFFFPNDPLYRVQLIQAYRYFGMWVAWERDNNQTAKVAAQAWCDAIAVSEENDFMPSVTIENVINVEASKCCCGEGGAGTVVVNPTIEIYPPAPIDPDDDYNEDSGEPEPPERWKGTYPTWNEFNDAKCRAANFYADNLISNIEIVKNAMETVFDSTIGRIIAAIGLIALDGPLPFLDAAALSILLVPNLSDWILDQTSDASDIAAFLLTVEKCDIVDIIYDGNGAQAIADNLTLYLKGKTSTLPATLQSWLNTYIDYAFGSRFANYIYSNMDNFVPAGYAITCPCGANAAAWLLDFEDQLLSGVALDGDRYSIFSNGRAISIETAAPLTGTASVKIVHDATPSLTGVDMVIDPDNTTAGTISVAEGDTIEFDYSTNPVGVERYIRMIYQAGGVATGQLGGMPVQGLIGAPVSNGTFTHVIQAGEPTGTLNFIKVLTNQDNSSSQVEWVIDNVRVLKP